MGASGLISVGFVTGVEPAVPDAVAPPTPLVGVEWLADRLGGPRLVVLDATVPKEKDAAGRSRYLSGRSLFENEGHIPGAHYADLLTEFSDPDGAFLFTRPSTAQLQRVLRRLGVDSDDTVIVYDSFHGAWAARVWWLLKAHGVSSVAVLDGNFTAWKDAQLPVRHGPEDPIGRPGTIELGEDQGRHFVDLVDVQGFLAAPTGGHLVSGLRQEIFRGDIPVAGRHGHIPGSVSVPFPGLLDQNGLLSVQRVLQQTGALTIDRDDRIITYCGGGVNAAGLALALTAAGFGHVSVYDGSLNEWSSRADLPLAVGD